MREGNEKDVGEKDNEIFTNCCEVYGRAEGSVRCVRFYKPRFLFLSADLGRP